MSNYPTKCDTENVTVHDSSKFAERGNLASLKSDVDGRHIDKLEKVPNGLNSLKSKVDKLDADELVTVPVDLSKLTNVIKIEVVRKDVYGEMVKMLIRLMLVDLSKNRLWS